MTKHSFRWGSFVFGLLFLAGVGNWAVWQQDVLTQRQLSLTTSAVLIFLGLLGVIATLRSNRVSSTIPKGIEDEEINPQH